MIGVGLFAGVMIMQATPVLTPGKIVMYRASSVMGFAIACPIRFKGKELVELGRGKFAEWSVPPGRYMLTNKTSSVEVSVNAGETRYVRCSLKQGIINSRADLQLADQEAFAEHENEYTRTEINTALITPSAF